MPAQRMAMVIGVRPEKLAEYKRLHAEPWPEMNEALSRANIRNYSIYLREPENLLFGYWEYTGTDYAADMKVLDGLAVTKRWLALTDPCQMPLASRADGEWWSTMPEIFHLD
jgi:L-rhamnose mutarotase